MLRAGRALSTVLPPDAAREDAGWRTVRNVKSPPIAVRRICTGISSRVPSEIMVAMANQEGAQCVGSCEAALLRSSGGKAERSLESRGDTRVQRWL